MSLHGRTCRTAAPPLVVAADGRRFCMLALHRMNVVAVTTILVLQDTVTGHRYIRNRRKLPNPSMPNPPIPNILTLPGLPWLTVMRVQAKA